MSCGRSLRYVFIGAYRGLCYKTSTFLSSFDFRIPFILLRYAFRYVSRFRMTSGWHLLDASYTIGATPSCGIPLETVSFTHRSVGFRNPHWSLLSLLFPFGTYTIVSTRASTIYSDSALRAMADDKCSGWSVPVATEKALVTCASTMNVRIIDPVDHVRIAVTVCFQEGMYLLHSKNPKSLIPMSSGFSLGSPYKVRYTFAFFF
uniref:Uncharacterized protein n=1 Tax=Parascaris equorum TaxID=6256 RepID=A0A914SIE3_PAREQ